MTRLAVRHRVVGLLFLMNLVNYVDRICLSVAAPVMIASLGWDKATFGVAFSATLAGYAFGQLPAGVIITRTGGRVALAVLSLCWSLMTILTPVAAASRWLFFVVRILLGIFEAGNSPGQATFNAQWLPAREYARGQAISFAGTQAGQLLAFPLVSWLLVRFTWPAVFYVLGVLGLVWTIGWLAATTDRPEDHPRISAEELALIRRERLGRPPAPRIPWGLLLRSPSARALVLAALLWGYTGWLIIAWFPTYLVNTRGVTMTDLGWLGMIPTALGMIGMLCGAAMSDWLLARGFSTAVARKTIPACTMAAGAILILVALRAGTVGGAVASLSAHALLSGLAVAGFFALPPVLLPRAPGIMAACMSAAFGVGGIIGPSVAGFLVEASGQWTLPFVTACGSSLIAAALLAGAVRMEPIAGTDGIELDEESSPFRAAAGHRGANV